MSSSSPYNICQNEQLGRYLCAARDLKAGEIIMQETPAMVGSPISAFSICFRCAARLSGKYKICEKCHAAPVCQKGCSTAADRNNKWHTDAECLALAKLKFSTRTFLHDNPQVCMPLRIWLVKSYNVPLWTRILKLEAHIEERRGSVIWDHHKVHVEQLLKDNVDRISVKKEVVQRICGILDVNTFELRPATAINNQRPGIKQEDCLRGLYLKPALMAHNCLSNTHLSTNEEYVMIVRASRDIAKGDIISFNYTNGLQGTAERQMHLKMGKYFTCSCQRCADPLELGTHLSSILCPQCKNGYIQQRIDSKYSTKCSNADCAKQFQCEMLNNFLAQCQDQFNLCDTQSLQDMLKLKHKLLKNLHKNHYILWELNQMLIVLMSNQYQFNNEVSEACITTRMDLCADFMEILRVLDPGISTFQGITLYELYKSQVSLAKLLYHRKGSLRLDEYCASLKEAEGTLKEAIGHLVYEPKETQEGALVKRAIVDLQVLRGTLKDVDTLLLGQAN